MAIVLGKARLMTAIGLLAVIALCLAFAWITRDAMAHLASSGGHEEGLVDLSPWQTAQALAGLAVTAEEAGFAREAERLADHEVDQAFASALRQAGTQRRSLNGEALLLSKKVDGMKEIVKQDQARVRSLTQAGSARGNDDLDIAKAQLGLDSDELADAQKDLARVGGDERVRIQQELSAHEAAMHAYDAHADSKIQNAVASAQQKHGSLASQLSEWINQRTRYQLVQRAMQQAQDDAAALTTRHNRLEGQANAAARPPSGSLPDKSAVLADLSDRSERSQLVGIYDDRIATERQLAAIYGKWAAQLVLQRRILLHLMLQGFALIAFVLLCVILIDALARYLIERHALDRRRMQTLRIIFRFSIQLLGVLVILIVIFGAPSQTPTIVGLTTAGLTVVLQDFIIAFFGWFVLMGKNGIRIGDWVEINGVGGEVVEIGIFRTAMLETGNWTDKGHPTGRRVTFINSFAIKGQYFNFSTTGQWMWDEITLSIPASGDAYGMIERVRQAVLEETEKDARLAEDEWRNVTRRNGMSQFTASPAVDMRPGVSGIDVVIRYVTRATDRFEVRNRLYQRVIVLLHKPGAPSAQIDLG
ncbi:MAG: mechanosensitive ion channel family protein [Acidobacteriota bacterium]|nr:mechanosensitive ion channel family protein [Acidobacteriota bacterium]